MDGLTGTTTPTDEVRPRNGEGSGLVLPGDVRTMWYIARRAALESMRDRTTLGMNLVFVLLLPALAAALLVQPAPADLAAAALGHARPLGTTMAVYLLVVGLIPSTGATNVAAGVFAGEKEKGNLAPLLATPASNAAIFAGKALGAVLPALLYAATAEIVYLAGLDVAHGPGVLRLLPPLLSLGMLAMVPGVAFLGVAIAGVVSSHVRTYTAAQMVTSLVLLPVTAVLFGVAFKLYDWGPGALATTVIALVAGDVLLIRAGAATWRREEVMAQR